MEYVAEERLPLASVTATTPVKAMQVLAMCSGSEAGSYLRLVDSCITQL